MHLFRILVTLLLPAAALGQQDADEVFEGRVKPLLAQCSSCHNENTRSSGLVVTRRGLMEGGARHGAAITPGSPDDSILIKVLRGQVTPQMPMGQPPFSAAHIEVISAWIRGLKPEQAKTAADSKWWAFRKPVALAAPQVRTQGWVRNEIDRFVLAKLEEKRLSPSPEVSPRALLRRAFFDLIGMPPTPTEATAFLEDKSPDAYEKLIDRLLADPRYGERWGRHWLDLARYADTQGFENDREDFYMWRYRDYVFDAFNTDKPYDLFVKEQLAADEMEQFAKAFPGESGKAQLGNESLAALGFLRVAPIVPTSIREEGRQLLLDDLTGTVSTVYLGLTVKCANCHDHKYDPIKQRDFYRLEAFFTPIDLVDVDLPLRPELRELAEANIAEVKKKLQAAEAAFTAYQLPSVKKYQKAKGDGLADDCFKKQVGDAEGTERTVAERAFPGRKVEKEIVEMESHIYRIDGGAVTVREDDKIFTFDEKQKYIQLLSAFADQANEKSVPNREIGRWTPKVHAVRSPAPRETAPALPSTFVHPGGEWHRLGERVEPGFLSVVTGNPDPAPTNQDFGVMRLRSVLAEWIASPENPLTARVMVNRIWQHHFGEGIVATPSDFGRNGAKPTHPKLLDWLAVKFVESGWSIKTMHRLMMTSATYRQSSMPPKRSAAVLKAEQADPANQLLWRQNRVRVEAEVLRDSILAVAGRLNPERGGPGVFPTLPGDMADQSSYKGRIVWESSQGNQALRRSVYIFQRRNLAFPYMALMDAPVFMTSCERRSVSTTTVQSLLLFNGEMVNENAKYMAARVAESASSNPEEQVRAAFRLALTRDPEPAELRDALDLMSKERKDGLTSLCKVLMNTNEFAYVD